MTIQKWHLKFLVIDFLNLVTNQYFQISWVGPLTRPSQICAMEKLSPYFNELSIFCHPRSSPAYTRHNLIFFNILMSQMQFHNTSWPLAVNQSNHWVSGNMILKCELWLNYYNSKLENQIKDFRWFSYNHILVLCFCMR